MLSSVLTHKLQLDEAAQQPDGAAGDGQLAQVQHGQVLQHRALDARVLEVLPQLHYVRPQIGKLHLNDQPRGDKPILFIY